MTVREYIGARYVPLFMGEWDNSETYEPLSIVLNEGNSYTSRQYVPTGIAITNEAYWAETGNYNAQIEQYRQEVASISNALPLSNFDSTNTVKKYVDDKYKDNKCFIDSFGADYTGVEYSDDAIEDMIDYIIANDLHNVYITCIGGYYKFQNTIDFSALNQRVVCIDFKGSVLETEAEIGFITPQRAKTDDELVSELIGNFTLIGNNDTTHKAIKCQIQCSYHDIIIHGFTEVIFYGTHTEGTLTNTIQGCNFVNIMCYNYNDGTVGFLNTTDCMVTNVYMWGFKYAIVTNFSHFNSCYLWGLYPETEIKCGFVDARAYLYEIGEINTKPSNLNNSLIVNCEIGTMNRYFCGLFKNVNSTNIIYGESANHIPDPTHRSYIFYVYTNEADSIKMRYDNIQFVISDYDRLKFSNEPWGYYKFVFYNSSLDSRSFFIDEMFHNDMVNKALAETVHTLPNTANTVFKLLDINIGASEELNLNIEIETVSGPQCHVSFMFAGTGSSPTVMPQIMLLRNPRNDSSCTGKNSFGVSYIYDSENEILSLYGMKATTVPNKIKVKTFNASNKPFKYNVDIQTITSDNAIRPTVITNALSQPYDIAFDVTKTSTNVV